MLPKKFKKQRCFSSGYNVYQKTLSYSNPPIAHLVNLSITHSFFPTDWKHAIVIPIFKSGDRHVVSNYRPISLLPVISKVAEKVVINQLTDHINSCNPGLNPVQFGFRKLHSTETAVLHLTEQIRSVLDKGGVVGAVFLDLSKAFDTVNHDVLGSKLNSFNLSSNTLAWISSYLSNRRQCVKIKGMCSSFLGCTTGVPQGSVLGPLLFSLYINDLPQHCHGVEVQLYADDTVLYTHATSAQQAAIKLTNALVGVAEWLDQSCLTLNIGKTKGMFFSKTKLNILDVNICFKGEQIETVTEFKYLGVLLDSNLTFKKHIKKMTKIIKYNLANFRQIRSSLSTEAAKVFLHALIFSHIAYCITCWGQASQTTIRPLESLYKQALKIFDKKPFRHHHCDILHKYNLLTFENFRIFSNLCTVYKILKGLAPTCLSKYVCYRGSVRTTRIASLHSCTVPFCYSAFRQAAFSVKAVIQWNTIPDHIKTCDLFGAFKVNIKKHLKLSQQCIH